MIKDEIVVMAVPEYQELQKVAGIKGRITDSQFGFIAIHKGVNSYATTSQKAVEKCYNESVRTLSDSCSA